VSDVYRYTTEIKVARVLNDGLIYGRFGGETRSDPWSLWVRAKVRKPTHCFASGLPIAPGEMAFRPIGNQDYRSRRLSAEFVSAAIKAWMEEGAIDEDGNIRPLDKGED
jgi:hypothetical protein